MYFLDFRLTFILPSSFFTDEMTTFMTAISGGGVVLAMADTGLSAMAGSQQELLRIPLL